MGKISLYSNASPVALTDKIIGTSVGGSPADATKNFLISDLVTLFQSNMSFVSSVALSGGTTGLTVSGSPITDSGTMTLGGTLGIANGGTGATTKQAAIDSLTSVSAANQGDVLTKDASGNAVFQSSSSGLFAQLSQSAPVTNTTTETSIVGFGVGSLTVPRDTFIAGNSYHAKIGGMLSAQNNDQITIRIKSGTTVLATTGTIDLSPVTNLAWEIELDFTIQTIGVSGTVLTNGNFAYNRDSLSLEGYVFQDSQTIDTTSDNTLSVTVQWGQAKTQDTIYSSSFVLYKTY